MGFADFPLSRILFTRMSGRVYHLGVRRIVLYLLIGLLPLQTWAVVSMSQANHAGTHAKSAAAEPHGEMPCHAQDESALPDGSQAGFHDQRGDPLACDNCQVCDLCHLVWSLFLPASVPASAQGQRLSVGQPAVWPSRHWPPPLEPPRL